MRTILIILICSLFMGVICCGQGVENPEPPSLVRTPEVVTYKQLVKSITKADIEWLKLNEKDIEKGSQKVKISGKFDCKAIDRLSELNIGLIFYDNVGKTFDGKNAISTSLRKNLCLKCSRDEWNAVIHDVVPYKESGRLGILILFKGEWLDHYPIVFVE